MLKQKLNLKNLLIFGMISALTTPVDIFPKIRMPVIAIAWQYSGLPPEEMEGRVVTPYERALTTVVNDMDHMESQSLQGMGFPKRDGKAGPLRVRIQTVSPQRLSAQQRAWLKQLADSVRADDASCPEVSAWQRQLKTGSR